MTVKQNKTQHKTEHHETSNKPLHCSPEFGSRMDTPRHHGGYEQRKPSDKKRDVLTINRDLLVMGHKRVEEKGRVKKTPRQKELRIPVRNMHNRFIQQGDRKREFF